MSPQFRNLHRPPLFPITDRFLYHQLLSKVFERLLSVCLGRFMEYSGVLSTTKFAYRKCHCKLRWRVDRRVGSCRLISVHPLMRSTVIAFSTSSPMLVLEVLCCLFWHSFSEADHSTLWWMIVGVNWLTLCQECRRAVVSQKLFLLNTLELFSILENKLIGDADDSTLMAVVPSPGVRVTIADSLSRNLVRV